MRRDVGTGVAIALGAVGFLLGMGLFTGFARLNLPPVVMVGGPFALAVGSWLAGRRDVAVGLLMGLGTVVLLVVSAIRAMNMPAGF
jgi:hypothetical protein